MLPFSYLDIGAPSNTSSMNGSSSSSSWISRFRRIFHRNSDIRNGNDGNWFCVPCSHHDEGHNDSYRMYLSPKLCTNCLSPNRLCLPIRPTLPTTWSTSNSAALAEDGGICLAEYSPNGDYLCSLTEMTLSDKSDSISPSLSCSSSISLSNGSFISSNESLAEKASSLSMEFTDSGNTSEDADQLSLNSMASNEAEAVTSFSSSLKDSSQSLDQTQSSLLSFAEMQGPCGGEGLAERMSSSEEEGSIPNSYSSLASTPTTTNNDVFPAFVILEEITRL